MENFFFFVAACFPLNSFLPIKKKKILSIHEVPEVWIKKKTSRIIQISHIFKSPQYPVNILEMIKLIRA